MSWSWSKIRFGLATFAATVGLLAGFAAGASAWQGHFEASQGAPPLVRTVSLDIDTRHRPALTQLTISDHSCGHVRFTAVPVLKCRDDLHFQATEDKPVGLPYW